MNERKTTEQRLAEFAHDLEHMTRTAAEEYTRLRDSGAVGPIVENSAGEAFISRMMLRRFYNWFPELKPSTDD